MTLNINTYLCPQHRAIPYLMTADFPGMARHAQGLAEYMLRNYDLHSSRIDENGDVKPALVTDLRACWLALLGMPSHVRVTALATLAARTYDEAWASRYEEVAQEVEITLDRFDSSISTLVVSGLTLAGMH